MTYSSLYFIYWCTIVTVNLDWMVQVLDRAAVIGTMNVDRRARGTIKVKVSKLAQVVDNYGLDTSYVEFSFRS